MLKFFVISFLGRLCLRIPLISSPLLIGLWVLILAFRLSAWIGVLGIRWFGLILFLVYIGGILVIFIYFVAITPNQQHELKIFYVIPIIFFLFLIIVLLGDLFGSFSKVISFNRENIIFSISHGFRLIFIFIMLFVGLVIVVKVTNRISGPLRPFWRKYV